MSDKVTVRIRQHTLEVDIVHASTALFQLHVALESATLRIGLVVLLALLDNVRNEGRTDDVIARLGLCDMQAVEDCVDLVALELRIDTMLEERVASGSLENHDALVRVTGALHVPDALCIDDLVDHSAALGREVVQLGDISLVEDEDGGLVGEQGLDGMEELALRFNRVAALLGKVHEVQDAGLQVGERRDTLHLDVVHLLKRMVEDTGCVDDLPPHVAVVEVADEERLGRECVRLDVDVRSGDFVEEGRLADIRVSTDEQRACSRVDRGKTRQVLANLLQELKRLVLPLHYGGHTTERSSLELLAAVQTVAELEQTDVVLGYLVDEMPCCAELAESKLVVVLVVQDIEERGKERMQVLRESQ